MSHENIPQTEVDQVDPVADSPAPTKDLIPSATGELEDQVSGHGIELGSLAMRVWLALPQSQYVEKFVSLANPIELKDYVLEKAKKTRLKRTRYDPLENGPEAEEFYSVLFQFLDDENNPKARELYKEAFENEDAPLSEDELSIVRFIDEKLLFSFLDKQKIQFVLDLGLVDRFEDPTEMTLWIISRGKGEELNALGLLDLSDPIRLIFELDTAETLSLGLLDRVQDIYGLKVALLKKRQIDKLKGLGLMFNNESFDGSTECMKLALELLKEGRIGEAIQILSEFEPNELDENNNWVFGVKSLRNVLSPYGVPHDYHEYREDVVDWIKGKLMGENTSQEDGSDIEFSRAMRTIFEDYDTFGAD